MHRSSPRDNCAPGVPIQKHSKPPTEFPVGRLFACSKGFIDVYKFLIRIFAIGGRASLLCVYFDALIFKGKSMLRWQEGFYLYKGNWGVCSCRREGTCSLIYFSVCFCRTPPVYGTKNVPSVSVGLSPVERRMPSLRFAAAALAVGAKDAVRPLRACSCRREGTCNLIYFSACFCRTLPVDGT